VRARCGDEEPSGETLVKVAHVLQWFAIGLAALVLVLGVLVHMAVPVLEQLPTPWIPGPL
jgi:hypothetical protein